MDKVILQIPDSLINAADRLIKKAEASDEIFKFTLVYLLNKYASSKVMGFDAVYVHVGKKYYCEEKRAYWADEAGLLRICKRVETLEKLLIGERHLHWCCKTPAASM